jgi:hypothetical protein
MYSQCLTRRGTDAQWDRFTGARALPLRWAGNTKDLRWTCRLTLRCRCTKASPGVSIRSERWPEIPNWRGCQDVGGHDHPEVCERSSLLAHDARSRTREAGGPGDWRELFEAPRFLRPRAAGGRQRHASITIRICDTRLKSNGVEHAGDGARHWKRDHRAQHAPPMPAGTDRSACAQEGRRSRDGRPGDLRLR